MEEIRIDLRKTSKEEMASDLKNAQNNFKLNHTMPATEEYTKIMNELFYNQVGENSIIISFNSN